MLAQIALVDSVPYLNICTGLVTISACLPDSTTKQVLREVESQKGRERERERERKRKSERESLEKGFKGPSLL